MEETSKQFEFPLFLESYEGKTKEALEDTKEYILYIKLQQFYLCLFQAFKNDKIDKLVITTGTNDYDVYNLYFDPYYIIKHTGKEKMYFSLASRLGGVIEVFAKKGFSLEKGDWIELSKIGNEAQKIVAGTTLRKNTDPDLVHKKIEITRSNMQSRINTLIGKKWGDMRRIYMEKTKIDEILQPNKERTASIL